VVRVRRTAHVTESETNGDGVDADERRRRVDSDVVRTTVPGRLDTGRAILNSIRYR